MTPQRPNWFHIRRRWPFLAVTLAVGLLALAGSFATGAELAPLSGFWSAACLRQDGARLIRCEDGKIVLTKPLSGPVDCVVDGSGGEVVSFRANCAIAVDAAGRERLLQRLPWQVRRCLRLSDGGYLMLVGGDRRQGALWRTQAVIWRPGNGKIERAHYVLPEWNAFDLVSGPAAVEGSEWVMVRVRKQAPFDPVWRDRPFLFEYRSNERRFLPLWKGTSFARPHVAVTLARWRAKGMETVALEDIGGGKAALSAYQFDGGMTMTATSGPLKLGSRLAAVNDDEGASPVALVRDGAGGRLVAFRRGNKMMLPGVCQLQPALQTELLAAAPVAWTTVSAGPTAAVLVLTAQLQLCLLPLRPLS